MKRWQNQMVRFGIVGIINTIIDYGLFNVLLLITGTRSGLEVGLLNILCLTVASVNSYYLNRTWTFRADQDEHQKQVSKFVVATGAGIFINSAVVTLVASLIIRLPVSAFLALNTAKLIGALFSVTWNFLTYRGWVFKKEKKPLNICSRSNPGLGSISPFQMGLDLFKTKSALTTNTCQMPSENKRGGECFLALAIFALALMARIPWLWLVPRYSDELFEVNLGYMISLGRAWPLHNVAHDIGAMHNYILGGLFWILGPSIYWPRLYVTILSAITVVLVYFLGKQMYNRWVGLVAAGLLLTNGMHILVTHMAWANCTTPFFFTLALMATIASEQKKSGKWLVFASFLWALALQTHSSVVVYVLVAVIYIARHGFRKTTGINIKWYLTSALAFIAGYFNMIYYNVISFGGSIRYLSHKSYALESQPGLGSYLHNLGAMLLELFKAMGSTYGNSPSPWYYLIQPAFAAMILFTVLGSYFALKLKKALPLWMMIGAFVVIPWINHRYAFFISTRYIMPIVLCALLLAALGLVQILTVFAKELSSKMAVYIPAAVLLIALIIWQSIPFYSYCNIKERTNESNYMALSVLSNIKTISKNENEIVLLDQDLPIENQPLPYLLSLSQKKYLLLNPIKEDMNESSLKNYWDRTLHFHSNEKIIAVLSSRTFGKLRSIIKTKKVVEISCKVTMPHNKPDRNVYLVEVAKR